MRKLVLFMHLSLDGFTARPNGDMDWVKVDEEMFDFARERTQASDLAIYGRRTYQLMQSYWPTAADKPKATKHDVEHSTWYNRVDKILVSKSWSDPLPFKTWRIGENFVEEVRKLKNGDGKEMIMFGSPTVAGTLIQENLIDDYWLFVNPVILGKGIPLFRGHMSNIDLTLTLSRTLSSGVICLHYVAKTSL